MGLFLHLMSPLQCFCCSYCGTQGAVHKFSLKSVNEVQRMPCCVPSGLKPGLACVCTPSLKAGVNERRVVADSFMVNAVLLVTELLVGCVQTIRSLP